MSDGTADVFMLVADINPGSGSADPSGLTQLNNQLFFAATDGLSGVELWRVTLTPGFAVSGNGVPIVQDAPTPILATGTDYGDSLVGQAITHTFTITNTGDGMLIITGTPLIRISGAAAEEFTLIQAPDARFCQTAAACFRFAGTKRSGRCVVQRSASAATTAAHLRLPLSCKGMVFFTSPCH